MPGGAGARSGAPDDQIDRGEAGKARPPETYRSPLALMAWWVWLAFAVANLIDIAVQGRDRLSVEAAAALVLVTGLMYVGALRPRVIAAARGIVVRNPLRDHRVPWTAVTNVDVRDLLRVHAAWKEPASSGQGQQAVSRPEIVQRTRVVQAWALQSPRRSAGTRPSAGRYDLARRSVGGAAASADPPSAVHRKETERIARALTERARRERADAIAASTDAPETPGPPGTAETPGTSGTGPVSAWHWPSVLAIVIPALLLVAAILA